MLARDWSLAVLCCLFLFAFSLLFGQAKERVDMRPDTVMVLAFFKLSLTFHRITGERKGFEAVVTDRLFTDIAHAVRPIIDSFERFVNLVKRPLFLGEHAQGKVAIVSIASRVGLMHPKSRGLTSGMKIIACDTPHGVKQGILEFEEALALSCQKGGQLIFTGRRFADELLGKNPIRR